MNESNSGGGVRTLTDMVRDYALLLEDKATLEQRTKDNNAAIEAAKKEIAQQMVDDDTPSITTGGYTYSLAPKVSYRKRSEAELAESGADFFTALRREGLGDIIKETVNPQTLNTAIRSYVEENDELSEGLAAVITSYEYNDINRRKAAQRAGVGKKAKKA